jgi:hypothetical protein
MFIGGLNWETTDRKFRPLLLTEQQTSVLCSTAVHKAILYNSSTKTSVII